MSLKSIDLELGELLHDEARRQKFFRSITQDEIASQIRLLRKRRGLTQSEFAERANMKQSAVSRIEQAEYSSWTLTTLFKAADALKARWKLILQPAEEAVEEFETQEVHPISPPGDAANSAIKQQEQISTSQTNQFSLDLNSAAIQLGSVTRSQSNLEGARL